MRHHFMDKNHILELCYVCGHPLHDHIWKSDFYDELHYKSTTCTKCGKTHSIRVNFHGSGHDTWEKGVKDFIKFKMQEEDSKKVIK